MHTPKGASLRIAVELGPSEDGLASQKPKPSLEEKINYALDQIEGDFNVGKAIDFLCKVYCHFEKRGIQNSKEESLLARIIPALEDFAPEVLNSEFYVPLKRTLTDEERAPDA